jgi:hypothetical protein
MIPILMLIPIIMLTLCVAATTAPLVLITTVPSRKKAS